MGAYEMSDVPNPEPKIRQTDAVRLDDYSDRFQQDYDDVFDRDGSLLQPLSVLDDPTDLDG